MSEDLAAELNALEARSWALAETQKAPRSAMPALFRTLRSQADSAEQRRVLGLLGRRLVDPTLRPPALELAREVEGGVAAYLDGVRESLAEDAPWCGALMAGRLGELLPEPAAWLELLELLGRADWDQAVDPSEQALALGVEDTASALLALLDLRLKSRGERRDRLSAQLSRGALRFLAEILPDDPRVVREIGRVLAAETRRADGEPKLALEALEALRRAPPLGRFRLLTAVLETLTKLKRKKVIEHALALREEAARELGATAEEQADLTARSGGLGANRRAHLVLDADVEAELWVDAQGIVATQVPAETDREDRRVVDNARRELESAWHDLSRRLETALIEGRSWSGRLWRAIFLAHPLWRELAGRLTWERAAAGPEGEAGDWQQFDLGGREEDDGLADLLGDSVTVEPEDRVRLVYPALLDAEEAELWRQRVLEQGRTEPIPQLLRGVAIPDPEGEEADPFARFAAREAYQESLGELARASGYKGYPFEGKPPWELWRPETQGVEVTLAWQDAPTEARRTAFGAKVKEARVVKKTKGRQGPPSRETRPRARLLLARIKVREGAEAEHVTRLTAEVVRDLEALTDPLATPSDGELRLWQQDKWRQPQESWKAIVLAYRQGSPALLRLRRELLAWLAERAGLALRLEDRFAITRQHVVELGTGLVHEGAKKDHLPAWKAAERAEEGNAGQEPLPLPLELRHDAETPRIVALVLGLSRWEALQAETA